MTIPTLINKYNQTVTETRLKQFYSMINQAAQLSEIDNGDKMTWNFEENCPVGSEYSEECLTKNFEKFLKPYLKITGYEYGLFDSDGESKRGGLVVYLPNGSALCFGYKIKDLVFYPIAANVKKTNSLDGKDFFSFGIYPTKQWAKKDMYSIGKGYEPYIPYAWDGNYETLPCIKKVQLNGWKFPDECNPWK